VAHRSAHSKSGIERLPQSRIAERLEQALHGTLLEQAWTDGLITVSGDEDDGNLLPAKRSNRGPARRAAASYISQSDDEAID
jgi:hypothetical protein